MDYMREKGLTLLRNGYPVIPLRPGEKRPAIDGWRQIEITEQRVAEWSGGIGIRTGEIVLLDVDIPNAVADRVRSLSYRILGPAPVRIGNPPKLGLVYRADTVLRTRLSVVYYDREKNRCALEFLADGRQFVAYNDHPITRKPYYWLDNRNPETVPASDLTVVTEAQVLELFAMFDEIAREEGWTKRGGLESPLEQDENAAPRTIHRDPIGLEDDAIRAALMAVPNDARFDAREDWLKIGFAVHHETAGSEFGRELWHEWSTQHPSHSEELFRKAWDSMGTRSEDRSFAPVTFRYIQGIVKKQLRDEAEKEIDRLSGEIDLAVNLEGLMRTAAEIGRIPGIDPVQREAFASLIKANAKRFHATLSIASIRDMLKPRQTATEIPKWLRNWVFLKQPGQFYNLTTAEYIDRFAFDLSFARHTGEVSPTRFAMQLAKIPVYYNTAYLPDKEPVYTDETGIVWVNVYREHAPEMPAKYSPRDLANIEIVKDHARHLFGADRERDIEILHSVLAYIVQTRKRVNWLVLIQGAEQIGKTFYAQLLRAVLGKGPHVHEVTTETLTESSFTSWATGHLVVYIEELMLHGKRYDVLNKMKSYITNQYVSIHPKYHEPRDVLNTTSYFAFTNFRNAVPITDGDSRYFIMLSQWQNSDEVRKFKNDNPAYYPQLWNALEESPGALRRWLMEYELHPEFLPDNRAPPSHGRELVIEEAKPDLQREVEDLLLAATVPGVSDDLVVMHLLRDALGDETGALPPREAVKAVLYRLQFTPVGGGQIKVSNAASGIRRKYACWSRNRRIVRLTTAELRQRLIDLGVA
jgi:hypothetical protein